MVFHGTNEMRDRCAEVSSKSCVDDTLSVVCRGVEALSPIGLVMHLVGRGGRGPDAPRGSRTSNVVPVPRPALGSHCAALCLDELLDDRAPPPQRLTQLTDNYVRQYSLTNGARPLATEGTSR
jgi:hypothetical protein